MANARMIPQDPAEDRTAPVVLLNDGERQWLEDAIRSKLLRLIDFADISDLKMNIASGGFGVIHAGEWRDMKVAIKVLFNPADFIQEVGIHRLVQDSQNIVKFYGITQLRNTGDYGMVLQFAGGGSLREYLSRNFSSLDWGKKMQIARDVAAGINFIHADSICHHDLHSRNVLIDNSGRALITDFGLSRYLSKAHSNNGIHGIVPYISPERLRGKPFDRSSDVYSLGVIMWELTSGYPPFKSEDMYALFIQILNGKREKVIPGTPEAYANLYQRCWDYHPSNRPSLPAVLKTLDAMMSDHHMKKGPPPILPLHDDQSPDPEQISPTSSSGHVTRQSPVMETCHVSLPIANGHSDNVISSTTNSGSHNTKQFLTSVSGLVVRRNQSRTLPQVKDTDPIQEITSTDPMSGIQDRFATAQIIEDTSVQPVSQVNPTVRKVSLPWIQSGQGINTHQGPASGGVRHQTRSVSPITTSPKPLSRQTAIRNSQRNNSSSQENQGTGSSEDSPGSSSPRLSEMGLRDDGIPEKGPCRPFMDMYPPSSFGPTPQQQQQQQQQLQQLQQQQQLQQHQFQQHHPKQPPGHHHQPAGYPVLAGSPRSTEHYPMPMPIPMPMPMQMPVPAPAPAPAPAPVSIPSVNSASRHNNLNGRNSNLIPGNGRTNIKDFFDSCRKGNLEAIRWHLDHGADVMQPYENMSGRTPLHAVAMSDKFEAVKMLCEAAGPRLNLNELDDMSQTPLHLLTQFGRDSQQPLMYLLERGANPNLQDSERRTPLMMSFILDDNAQIVETLLDYGADPTIRCQEYNALAEAALRLRFQCVKVLLETDLCMSEQSSLEHAMDVCYRVTESLDRNKVLSLLVRWKNAEGTQRRQTLAKMILQGSSQLGERRVDRRKIAQTVLASANAH